MRMSQTFVLGIAVATLVALPGALHAAEVAPGMRTEERTAAPPPVSAVISEEEQSVTRAKALIGSTVLSLAGEELGSVRDVLFSDDGKVVGIVVTSGGVFGIGGKVVGISYEQTQIMSDPSGTRSVVQANLTKDQIDSAPSFKTKEDLAAEKMQETAPAMGGSTSPGPLTQ